MTMTMFYKYSLKTKMLEKNIILGKIKGNKRKEDNQWQNGWTTGMAPLGRLKDQMRIKCPGENLCDQKS